MGLKVVTLFEDDVSLKLDRWDTCVDVDAWIGPQAIDGFPDTVEDGAMPRFAFGDEYRKQKIGANDAEVGSVVND